MALSEYAKAKLQHYTQRGLEQGERADPNQFFIGMEYVANTVGDAEFRALQKECAANLEEAKQVVAGCMGLM